MNEKTYQVFHIPLFTVVMALPTSQDQARELNFQVRYDKARQCVNRGVHDKALSWIAAALDEAYDVDNRELRERLASKALDLRTQVTRAARQT